MTPAALRRGDRQLPRQLRARRRRRHAGDRHETHPLVHHAVYISTSVLAEPLASSSSGTAVTTAPPSRCCPPPPCWPPSPRQRPHPVIVAIALDGRPVLRDQPHPLPLPEVDQWILLRRRAAPQDRPERAVPAPIRCSDEHQRLIRRGGRAPFVAEQPALAFRAAWMTAPPSS